MGRDIECKHNLKIKYFDSMYNGMTNNIESLKNETHIDFVLDKNIHLDCCNFLRCNEFGNIIPNIPKPSIKNMQILGNDRVNMELSPHCHITNEPQTRSRRSHNSRRSLSPNENYEILSYRISYCYDSTQIDNNIDEKQEKMQWETIDIDNNNLSNNNLYFVEFEIDDLNLVNADLIIKIKYLLQRDAISMWTNYSDIYQLTQKDLIKSMSHPCLDSRDFIPATSNLLSPYNPSPYNPSPMRKYDSTSTQQTINTMNTCTNNNTFTRNDTVSPLFSREQKYSVYDDNEVDDKHSNATVKYHGSSDDSSDTTTLTSDDDNNTVHEKQFVQEETQESKHNFDEEFLYKEEDDIEIHHIDIIKFKKDLYFDQDELEQEMIQNQQLIQEFMKGINSATKANNDLVHCIKNVQKQQELWKENKNDIMAMRKKPKLTLINTNSFIKNGKHLRNDSHTNIGKKRASVINQKTPLPQHGNNRLSISSETGSFNHTMTPSLGATNTIHEVIGNNNNDKSKAVLHAHRKTPSITEQITRRLSKLSHKLSNFSGNDWNYLTRPYGAKSSGLSSCDETLTNSLLNQQLKIYAEMCHILQEQPQYLASLTHSIELKNMGIWVKTIVCDMFGDESDSRNEHLLLKVFECIISEYARNAKNIDLFLKGESVVTKMISSFMNDRCPENIKILKMILQRPMRELIFDDEKELNLEIDPIQVYKQVVSYDDAENDGNQTPNTYNPPKRIYNLNRLSMNQLSMNQPRRKGTVTTILSDSSVTSGNMLKVDSLNSASCSLEQGISIKMAASNENVKRIIDGRIEQIQVIVTFFLDRMIENARVISFGIRWICKMVSQMSKVIFSDASKFELNALIGKIIYLRYLEPALNNPYEFLNMSRNDKTSTNTRKDKIENNFDIICQILRSILCAERFTHPIITTDRSLLHWIKQQQIETVPLFYEKLLDLNESELKDRLAVDRYLIGCKNDLQLKLQQIYLLHHEIYRNQDIWSKDNGQTQSHLTLLDVLDRLNGDAPYNFDKDKMINLDLTIIDSVYDPFFILNNEFIDNDDDDDEFEYCDLKCNDDELLDNDESYIYNVLFEIKFKNDDIMGIRYSLKELLLDKQLPQNILFKFRHSLFEFLNELRNWSEKNNKDNILNLIESILQRMNQYRLKHGLNGYNSFIFDYHLDIKKIVNFSKRLQLKAVVFAKARDATVDHTNYLQNKLILYKENLDKDKSFLLNNKSSIKQNKSKQNKSKQNKTKQRKPIKITFKTMLDHNVIIDNNNDDFCIKLNNNIIFHFFHQNLDIFQFEIKPKRRSKSKLKDENLMNNVISSKPLTLSIINLLEMRESNHTQFNLQSFIFDVDGTIDLLNGILANKI